MDEVDLHDISEEAHVSKSVEGAADGLGNIENARELIA